MTSSPLSVLTALLMSCAVAAGADAPTLDPAHDADHFGARDDMLFWSQAEKVAGFRNIDQLFPTRRVEASGFVLNLPDRNADLGALAVRGAVGDLSLDAFFDESDMSGMLVLKNGEIVYERYGLGNGPDTRWMSFSVTKSVVSMLFGAAIADGHIESVDMPVIAFLPELKGSGYEAASIADILTMSSGVDWDETYSDPSSDVNRMPMDTPSLIAFLAEKGSVAKPGRRFNYNTAETNLAGAVLRAATGRDLASYLSETIWAPFGMEADAHWMLGGPDGGEIGGCCLSATLRDYGRLGLFALSDGVLPDGRPALAKGWMQTSTRPSYGYPGYGYQWWLRPDGGYQAEGIFGQGIYIYPQDDVVIAVQSARAQADDEEDWALQYGMHEAVVSALRQ
ncbi:serine hydrolase [Thalassococcus sp. S3]|uniref:serine hydrolase domain-containing protein n=1 Tax=Thalassococcus sp. S3 TaxID=2017482 RepID=UPI0013EE4B66|nr:serine hydrolase domain-containing protein [Thalassococcus sp. S3]